MFVQAAANDSTLCFSGDTINNIIDNTMQELMVVQLQGHNAQGTIYLDMLNIIVSDYYCRSHYLTITTDALII